MNNNILTYSYFKFIKILLIVVLIFIFLIFFALDSNPLLSLISLAFNLFICLNIASYLLFKNLKWNFGISFFFILKIFIGIFHYLYFIDSSYFLTGNYAYLTFEYDSVYDHLKLAVDHKKQYGIFAFFQKFGGITHQEIWSFISIPYVYYGKYFMNITPLNSFFASLTTLNLIFISKHFYSFSHKKLNYVFLLSSLFPLTFISSLLWRDIVGIYLLSLSFILIILSKKNIILNIISIIISVILSFSFRTLYPIIILFIFLINRFKINILSISIAVLLSSFIGFYYFNNYGINYVSSSDIDSIINYDFLTIIIKFPLGFIGPFPWNQFLDRPVFSYQIQEYIQAAFNLTFLFYFFNNFKSIISKHKNDFIFQVSILFIISGLLNPVMHMSYVSFAFIYLIPILFNYISIKTFFKRFLLIGLILFALNLIYLILFSGGLNLSSLWR